jgi:hypothetical protein
MDVSESEDPEGLRVFYYLVQDIKVSPSSPIAKNLLQRLATYPVPHLLPHLPPLQNQANIVVANSCPSLCTSALFHISLLHQCNASILGTTQHYKKVTWRPVLGNCDGLHVQMKV